MATTVGMVGRGSWGVQLKDSKYNNNNNNNRNNSFNQRYSTSPRPCHVSSSYGAVVEDPYRTLRIEPNASESEVRKAFRKLALQYHPDVCRENNSGVQFHLINEAYDIVMQNLRGESNEPEIEACGSYDEGVDEPMRGMYEPDWDMWEEWMGWEGAGIRDYSSHVNPYI